MKNFKPENYNSLSPYLIVKDAQRLINLIIEVFQGTPLRRFNRPDGSVMHAEIRIDDSVLMLSEATDEYPPNTTILHVYVTNADAVYELALSKGCKGLEQPKQQEGDQDKRGMFEDFAGNLWSVSTQIG